MNLEIPFNKGIIRGDQIVHAHPHIDNKVNLFFLHGAGNANRARFHPIRSQLSQTYDTPSIAFDYLGHGDSSAENLIDSLESRTEQAGEVIERVHQGNSLSLVASSMSAYIALKLTKRYEVTNLTLMVPAVYNKNAYGVPFSSGFTEIIRQNSSWVNSDAWSILEAYRGNLLIISAQNDEVIPNEVIKYIYDLAIKAKTRKTLSIPGADHQILTFINNRPELIKRVTEQIYQLIKE